VWKGSSLPKSYKICEKQANQGISTIFRVTKIRADFSKRWGSDIVSNIPVWQKWMNF